MAMLVNACSICGTLRLHQNQNTKKISKFCTHNTARRSLGSIASRVDSKVLDKARIADCIFSGNHETDSSTRTEVVVGPWLRHRRQPWFGFSFDDDTTNFRLCLNWFCFFVPAIDHHLPHGTATSEIADEG